MACRLSGTGDVVYPVSKAEAQKSKANVGRAADVCLHMKSIKVGQDMPFLSVLHRSIECPIIPMQSPLLASEMAAHSRRQL